MRQPSNDNPKEDEIIRLIEEGMYTQAFDTIISTYENELKRRCAWAMHRYVNDSIGEGEELAHDILMEFHRKIANYNPHIASVRTVLNSTAHKRLISRHKTEKSKIQKQNGIKRESELKESIESESRDPEKITLEQELLKHVEDALDRLHRKDRKIFYMKLEGYSTAKIIKATGMKESAINTNYHRTRKKMQAVLEDRGYYHRHLMFIFDIRLHEEAFQYFETNLYALNAFTSRYRICQYYWCVRWRLHETMEVLLMRK